MKNVFSSALAAVFTVALIPGSMMAASPQANAVPFLASNPTFPHSSWSGNPVTLKGTLTSPLFGTDAFTYDWNPGNGSAHCTGTVTNQFDIECAVTYTGSVGSVYTAVLTITDTTSGQVSPPSNCPPSITKGACYYTSLAAPPPNLPIEVNNAIDNGLWYLHKHMRHFTTAGGAPAGDWTGVGGNVDSNSAGGTGVNSLECSAFENSGFLQTNSPANPYSDDVRLCLNGIFDQLTAVAVTTLNDPAFGTFNPDSNGNGYGVQHNGYPENYQTGMMLDAVAGTQTPNAIITPGTNLATTLTAAGVHGTGPGGAYTYKDAVADMVDDYAYCQAPSSSGFFPGGGWHYQCREATGDNSISQWAAVGIIPAIRDFGATVPAELHQADTSWLDASFTQASVNNGYFGYNGPTPIWGPYADTPSGMVQLAMNGLGRGKLSPAGKNLWDSAETFIRDNFGNPQSAGGYGSLKGYYYGMFSFTKAMLLHDNSGTGLGNSKLTLLQSLDDPGTCAAPGVPATAPGSGSGPCYPALDWYGAQTPAFGGSAPVDGVARTIVGNQLADGSWFGQNYTGAQDYFQTGISITMLNQTVTTPPPVACFTANPSQVASGGPVILDGSCSLDQNPKTKLVSWKWDVSGVGTSKNFTIGPGDSHCLTPSCSKIKYNFTLPAGKSLPYNFPVGLRVTNNATPTPLFGEVVGTVIIAHPPNPPNANAGGPYNFCPNKSSSGALIYSPFLLDGSKSTNPDQGTTDGTAGAPPSTITAYDWDYSCSGAFNSAHGAQVNATNAFNVAAFYGTTFNACLRVTNNDNLAFPTAGLSAGLSSQASAQISIHNVSDENCTHCVLTLGGKAKAGTPGTAPNVQLYWTDTNTSVQFAIDHYNVYRSTDGFATQTQIAGAASSPFKASIKATPPPGGATLYFQDGNVVGGKTYQYRISPATANDTETCQGNVTVVVSIAKAR